MDVRTLLTVVATVTLVAASTTGGGARAAGGTRDRDHDGHGGIIVWTHRAAEGSEHLMVARADGSHVRPLTRPRPDRVDIEAQVSPDGRWVAYEADAQDAAAIHLVHPDGSRDHVVDVGCVDPCVAAAGPTWMSNHRLAFVLVKGPFDEQTGAAASAVLWTARIDGSHLRRLSEPGIDGAFEESYLRVSRDHRFLTFRRSDNGTGGAALFRRDRRTGHLTQLTPWGLKAEVNDLATAGRGATRDLMVFESYGRGDPEATFVDIATVPATCPSLSACTASIHWLTDNRASGRRNANPQWSPDGRSLVFTDRPSVDVENADVWTMRFGSERRHRVSTSEQFDYRPTWGAHR
jgi:WD40-like Beta Propeller Repeat